MALQHLRSSTAHKRPIPTAMSAGQIAINTNEGSPGLFFKDSNGDLVKVGPVHIGTSAPNSSPNSLAATALVTGTIYQILTVGNSDFTLVGASANTVGVVFTATGTTTGTGTVSGQQGNEKGEQWLDTTGSAFDLKIYDGTAWRSQAGEFVNVTGDTMTGNLVMNNANIVFEGATADDFETTLTVTDPTADRSIVLPDVSGDIVTTGDTGTVTSTMITDGTIVNADINASAEIAVSKLANGTARQLLQTDSGGSGVEFTSNVDVPGTLDVTNAATFDSTVDVAGLLSANGKLSHPAGTAAAVGLYAGSDTDTGIYSPGSNQFGISTAGTSRVIVDASGNVGIADTAPSEKLNVAGNIMLEGSDQYLYLTNAGTSNSGIYIRGRTSASELRSHSTGIFTWEVTGNEKMRLDSSGRLLVGRTASVASGSAADSVVQIVGKKGSPTDLGQLTIARGNSASALGSGAEIGEIIFSDNAGANFAQIQCNTDGASGTNDYPGRLSFYTTADGASSPTERLRIDSSGNLNFQQEASSNYPEQKLKWSNDSTTTNGFYISQDTNRDGRIWHEQGLDILFGTTNTERMRVDSAGRLLAGTSSGSGEPIAAFQGRPDAATDSGIVAITRSGTNPSGSIGELRFATGGDFNKYYGMILCQSDGTTSSTSLPGALRFSTTASGSTSPTERMRIDSAGRVHIGSSTAGVACLNIYNDGTLGTAVLFQNPNTGTGASQGMFVGNWGSTHGYLYNYENADLIFGTNSAERMRIDSAGRVFCKANYLYVQDSNTGFGVSDGLALITDGNSDKYIWNHENTSLRFGNNNSEKMRIDSAGGLLVGRTSAYNSSPGEVAVFEGEKHGVVIFNSINANYTCLNLRNAYANNSGNNVSGNMITFHDNGGTERGKIATNGSSTSYITSSDYRLKENVVPLTGAIDRISKFKVHRFNFIGISDSTVDGFLAHEAQTVVPEAVTGTKDEVDGDGNAVMQGIDQSKLVPLLTAALQEAITKIETLETKVAALEAG